MLVDSGNRCTLLIKTYPNDENKNMMHTRIFVDQCEETQEKCLGDYLNLMIEFEEI